MNTLLLSDSDRDVKRAAKIIEDGGLVGMPTETVYGLAADALNGSAVAKIFKAKGRPMDNPLIVHIADFSDIERYNLVSEIPDTAYKLAEKFWPGPLTMIMKKSDIIPDEVSAGLDSVAIRYPSHKTAQRLIKASKTVLAAPSANTSGRPSPTSASHVMDDLSGKIEAVIDSGECEVGVESTVITLVTAVPRILRPGAVTHEQIQSVIGKTDVDPAVINRMDDNTKASSPGMKYKHYSPKANVILLKGDSERFISYVNSKNKKSVAAICYDEDIEKLLTKTFPIGKEDDEKTQAHNVFDALRKVDENKEIKTVYAHCPQTSGLSLALYNRLIRAAGFEVTCLE